MARVKKTIEMIAYENDSYETDQIEDYKYQEGEVLL